MREIDTVAEMDIYNKTIYPIRRERFKAEESIKSLKKAKKSLKGNTVAIASLNEEIKKLDYIKQRMFALEEMLEDWKVNLG